MVLREEQVASKFYHHRSKGCTIVRKPAYYNTAKGKRIDYIGVFCQTHNNAEICRCGWRIGWHFGKNNRRDSLKNNKVKK